MDDGFQDVGPVTKFVAGRGRAVEAHGTTIAVFRRGENFHALDDACPHMGASLAGGRLEGCALTCHWHHWKFDLRDGSCDHRSWAKVRIWPTRVADGRLWIGRAPDLPQDEAPGDDADEPWIVWDDDKHLKKKD